MLTITIALMTAVQVAAPTPATGSLVGCISDRAGVGIPGVTISAKTGEIQRVTDTDTTGCYAFIDLPSASYRVTARLAGFDSITRDGFVLAPRIITRFDVTMSVSAICDCVRVINPRNLAEAWEQPGAILHVRILKPPAGSPIQSGTYRHAATVLHAVKRHTGEPAAAETAIVEYQRNGAPGPYDAGQELVIFPKWHSGARAFYGVGSDCCDNLSLVFTMRDGRVEGAPSDFSRYLGMRTDAFLDELRAASGGR